MTRADFLRDYRRRLINVEELRVQLAAEARGGGGSERFARRKSELEDELARNAQQAEAILAEVKDIRTYMMLEKYYLQGETDAAIAMGMNVSSVWVNRVRNRYLRTEGSICL